MTENTSDETTSLGEKAARKKKMCLEDYIAFYGSGDVQPTTLLTGVPITPPPPSAPPSAPESAMSTPTYTSNYTPYRTTRFDDLLDDNDKSYFPLGDSDNGSECGHDDDDGDDDDDDDGGDGSEIENMGELGELGELGDVDDADDADDLGFTGNNDAVLDNLSGLGRLQFFLDKPLIEYSTYPVRTIDRTHTTRTPHRTPRVRFRSTTPYEKHNVHKTPNTKATCFDDEADLLSLLQVPHSREPTAIRSILPNLSIGHKTIPEVD